MKWNNDLQCFLIETFHNSDQHSVGFVIGDDNCTDMSGAIRLASKIDPLVRVITTGYKNYKLDVGYVRLDDGHWIAKELVTSNPSSATVYARPPMTGTQHKPQS